MKALLDIVSIILFVVTYILYGFYIAVVVINVMMFVSVMAHRIRYKEFDKLQLGIFLIILLLSLPTFIFHDEIFFKWKPSVISWLFGIGMFISQYVGDKKTVFQRLLEKEKINLPNKVYLRVNLMWVLYFIIFGFINIAVAYLASTKAWVWFKLFGSLGSMLIICLLTILMLLPYIRHIQEQQSK